MPRGKWVLFDTNVYVAALREGVRGAAFARIRESAPRTFLASVVSAELRAGTVDQTGRSVVLELTDRFDRLGRVVTPEARSWSLASRTSSRASGRSRSRHSAWWRAPSGGTT